MAISFDYSITSIDSAGKGEKVVGITSITATESTGSGASRTLSITIKGKRIDSTYALGNAYCTGSSTLKSFVSSIGASLNGTERTFCTFKITVNASESGTASLGSSYYIKAGGNSDTYGDRSIKVTLNSVSGLTPYVPTYYIYYKKANGEAYATDSAKKNNTLTIRSTGPSKGQDSSDSTFTITGDANGGYFTSINITEDSITATKTSTTTYLFTKWNTNSDGTGDDYDINKQITMTKDIILYPKYDSSISDTYTNNTISNLQKPIMDPTYPYTYTVTYDLLGGTVSETSETSETVKTTRYWSFGGWATSSTATSANAATSYQSTTKLWAYWTYTDTKGKVTLPTPTRVGYNFLGWGTSSSQTSGLLDAGETPEISSDITYYAIWKADGSIRIYIDNTKKYQMAMIWMYYPTDTSDSKPWKLLIPYMKTDTNWKITAG